MVGLCLSGILRSYHGPAVYGVEHVSIRYRKVIVDQGIKRLCDESESKYADTIREEEAELESRWSGLIHRKCVDRLVVLQCCIAGSTVECSDARISGSRSYECFSGIRPGHCTGHYRRIW